MYEINYKTTYKNREKRLTKFKNDNTCINIICNVHILDEGIDIPECDAVYLTHPNNNPINIIQRISRSNRLDVNNKEKISKIFLWSKNQIKLENIINRLSKYVKINYGKENNNIINFNNRYNIIDTPIDTKFINIFLNKFKIENELNFDIKDKNVSDYLNITLDNLRRRLQNKYSKTKKFIENIDYMKIKSGKTTGVTYMINYQCFEKIAISGETEQSEIFRQQFIKLRKLIFKN